METGSLSYWYSGVSRSEDDGSLTVTTAGSTKLAESNSTVEVLIITLKWCVTQAYILDMSHSGDSQ